MRDLLEKRLHEIVEGTAELYGAKATLKYRRGYPVLENHAAQTDFAASVAGEIAGKDKVDTDMAPVMGAEDFSFMLNARPGAFIFVGNGDSAGLHHPAYNFNDEAIPFGTSYWVKLVETALAASRACRLSRASSSCALSAQSGAQRDRRLGQIAPVPRSAARHASASARFERRARWRNR